MWLRARVTEHLARDKCVFRRTRPFSFLPSRSYEETRVRGVYTPPRSVLHGPAAHAEASPRNGNGGQGRRRPPRRRRHVGSSCRAADCRGAGAGVSAATFLHPRSLGGSLREIRAAGTRLGGLGKEQGLPTDPRPDCVKRRLDPPGLVYGKAFGNDVSSHDGVGVAAWAHP